MHELSFDESTWDKKKILATLLVLGIVIAVGIYFIDKSTPSSSSVKGVETKKEINVSSNGAPDVSLSLPSKEDLQNKLNAIKKDIDSLNIVEIASSSPQVQKILKDIQSLQEYPSNQAKEVCYNLCRGL